MLCTRARHRDGVGMPDAGLHPHRDAIHKQHTEPEPSCCVPFSDPHVLNVARSGNTRQECIHSSAKTMGTSPPSGETRQECSHSSANTLGPLHHMARTHHTDDKSKERKQGGTSTKGSVLILTCVPLHHFVLPLSGCACSGTPAMATQGEARGHP